MASSSNPLPRKRKTFLQILDACGQVIRQIDLTDYPNANSQATISVQVQQRCDLGHYHNVWGPVPTTPWAYE